MLTPSEIETLRKQNKEYLRTVSRTLIKAKTPRLLRSAMLASARVYHVYNRVLQVFNRVIQAQHKMGYMPGVETPQAALRNKYTATIMSIMTMTQLENIKLDRWVLAQTETLNLKYMTLYMCYGPNALARYESWEARQQKKYLRESEQKSQTISKDRVIFRSIVDGHLNALLWQNILVQIEAPTKSAALWYMWPSLSPWYLLAHEEFRTDIMESKLCDSPMLVSRWKTYKKGSHIREICKEALTHAIQKHGELHWSSL